MRKSNHHAIRASLKSHPDGLTATEISEHTGKDRSAIKRALQEMPDVYIDRWVIPRRRRVLTPVYVAVNVPEDCPRP